MAWNGPLSYVKIRRRVESPCQVIAVRDVDVDYITHFITYPGSGINMVGDLKGKRFAYASRGSVEAGLLAHYFLKRAGVDPRRDLAACTFYEDRQSRFLGGERDVIERVKCAEYGAGAVSQRTLDHLRDEGALTPHSITIFWSSSSYSYCCFTAQGDLDPSLSKSVAQAFVSMDYSDPVGKAVLDSDGCKAFVPGTTEGWYALEKAAEEEGLI